MAGTTVGEAFVKIRPDTQGFQGEAESKLGGAGAGLGKIFGGIAIAGGALAGAHFLESTISEFQESAKVGALSAAVIKSTGGAANITAGQMNTLATALSNKSGVDDEQIQSSENVLATFTKVRNEVGKGNDIFNQASSAALDMSAALGTDLQGSTLQLGKALNDPIKGITALARAGVSFTAQQKDQIKTLVASGDTLGAQKLILKELSNEFSGAAEAAANPIDKLKVVLGNAKETIGGAIYPIVSQIAPIIGAAATGIAPIIAKGLGAVVPLIGPLLKGILPIFSSVVGAVSIFAAKFGPLLTQVFTKVGAVVRQVFAELAPILPKLATSFAQVGSGVVKSLLPAVPALGALAVAGAKLLAKIPPDVLIALVDAFLAFKAVKGVLGPLDQIAGIASKVLTPIKSLTGAIGPLTTGFQALGAVIAANPLGAIIVGITLLVAGAILLYNNFKPFRDLVDEVAGFLAGVFSSAVDVAKSALTGLGDAVIGVVNWFGNLPGMILGVLGDLGGLLLDVGASILRGLWTGIQLYVGLLWAFWVELPLKILGYLAGAAGWLLSKGGDIITGLWNGIRNTVQTVWTFFANLPAKIISTIGDIGGKLLSIGADIVHGIRQGISNAWSGFVGWIKDKIGDIPGAIADFLGIGSPSKVMAARIGVPIVTGIQAGIAQAWPGMIRDFQARTGDLTVGPVGLGGVSGPGLGAAALGGAPGLNGGVYLAPGAVTLIVQGNADADVLAAANDRLVADLTEVLKAG